MIYAFLSLFIIALLMFLTSKGHTATKWGAAIAFCGSVGFLSTVVNEDIRPYFMEHSSDKAWIDMALLIVKNAGSFTTQILLPYSFLLFATYSYDFISNAWKKRIAFIASIPVFITFVASDLYPDVIFNYLYITLWIGPYILIAAFLLFRSYLQEKNPPLRLDKLLAFFTASIPMLFDLYTGFIARIYGDNDAWRMNVYMIIALFFAYIYLAIRYGILGLKINLITRRLDKSIRVAQEMSAIYNHTIKNELAKLNLYLNRLEVTDHGQNDLLLIKQSLNQITYMSNQIQKQSRRIVAHPEHFELDKVIDGALSLAFPALQKKQIIVTKSYQDVNVIYCDLIHTTEVLQNLLMNACEAIDEHGKIELRVVETKRFTVVSIKDNGSGISSDVFQSIFQPFFSTKNNEQNYGLGLSYCYQVMQQHRGSIEFFSDGRTGTTAYLHFPKRKMKQK